MKARASAERGWAAFSLLLLMFLFGSALAQGLPDFTELVDRHSAAVVSINAEPEAPPTAPQQEPPGEFPIPKDSPFYDFFRHFFDQMPGMPFEAPIAQGSGFIIANDGYILTNAHVIEGAARITVVLSDRREFPATVVGVDPQSDVALLKIEAQELPVAKIGDSNELRVGQWVLAIGSPFGLDATATQGIISALGRSLPAENYVPFIQTDAAVNPGNSGGPLFNLDGEVIGVNSQIYSRTGGYMGVSFAIPINVAMEVAQQLRAEGKVSRGWLGVVIQEVTPDLARSFGLERPQGALVAEVLRDSPAAKAGLQVGDIIVEFNGQQITRSSELPPLVGRIRPGTSASTTVVRQGERQTLQVPIEELPEEQIAAGPGGNRLNIVVSSLPAGEAEGEGVIVAQVGPGPAARAGIRQGDIIRRIGQQRITNVAEFRRVVAELPTGQPISVLVERGGRPLFLALTIPG